MADVQVQPNLTMVEDDWKDFRCRTHDLPVHIVGVVCPHIFGGKNSVEVKPERRSSSSTYIGVSLS